MWNDFMIRLWSKLQREEEGQGLVEYGLILVLVSIVTFAALQLIGTNVDAIFDDVGSKLALP